MRIKYDSCMNLSKASNWHQKQNFALEDNKEYRFNCQWLGDFHAGRILSQSDGLLGEVVSVFETTINVKTNNDELLVITLGKIRSPVNMNVLPIIGEKGLENEEARRGFRGSVDFGCEAQIEKNTIVIGKVIFWLGECRIFRSAIDNLPTANPLSRFISKCDEIFNILKTHARRGCLLTPDITTTGLLLKFVKEQYNCHYGSTSTFNTSSTAVISRALMELCGRGTGYTPAGDDFIAGYLAVFNWISESLNFDSIKLPTYRLAPLTSWMSSKLIEYNSKKLCDEEIQDMIRSISAGDCEKYMSHIAKISQRGHTSGIDIVSGMTIALYAVIDALFETNIIGRFLSVLATKGLEYESQIKSEKEHE
jgi:Protein of unknown function (DUF2877)